jgi:hypothetical protein
VVNVPAGQTSFSTRVDLSATEGIYVDVSASFDPMTGVATWTFTSIDPLTLDVPADPLAGFLPPDTNAGNGMGFVNYTIQPRSGLTTGVTIGGQAAVVFDQNAAVNTAAILNTIDDGAPTSNVNPLPPFSPAAILLSWSGEDDNNGSGIATYTIFVSDNGGAASAIPSLTNTTNTSGTFTGQQGHTYTFYSIATDNVGNVQLSPGVSQSTTVSGLPNAVVFTTASQTLTVGQTSTVITVQLQDSAGNVAPAASNGLTLTLSSTSMGAQFLDANNQPITSITILAGSSTGTFQYVDPHAGTPTLTIAATGFSNTQQETIQADSTTTTMPNPAPALLGQMVTLTATVLPVAPGSGTPTGTVTFYAGNQVLGSSTLQLVNGQAHAVWQTTALVSGSQTISASYGGDTNFTASSSPPTPATVLDDQVTLASSADPSNTGAAVTFTATLTPLGPITGQPTGTVTFLDGNTVLQSGVPLKFTGGQARATFTTSALPAGTQTITAVYSGDTAFTATSASLTQQVGRTATTTTLPGLDPPLFAGQLLSLTATVGWTGAGTPTGTVTFKNGTTVLGQAAVQLVNGQAQATLLTAALPGGRAKLTAVYSGDFFFTGSTSGAVSIQVQPDTTRTVLKSSVAAPVWGQPVTFTATVSALRAGAGTPTGTVTFLDGATVLQTGVPLVAGKAQLTTTLAVGSHTITAAYSGENASITASAGSLIVPVGKAATTATLGASSLALTFGQSLTLTTAVSAQAPGAGQPTGTVTFKDGAMVLGTVGLQLVNGQLQAQLTPAQPLPGGNQVLTAVYNGDGNFSARTAAGVTVRVARAMGQTVLTSSLDTSYAGQPVTFTATVSGSGATPTGTVSFFKGTTLLRGGVVLANGVATFTTSTLAVKTAGWTIRAVYSGNSNFQGGSSSVSQVVNADQPAATQTVVSLPGSGASAFGQAVTLVATVSSAQPRNGLPAGLVTFFDNGKKLGTAALAVVNGLAQSSLTTAALPVGSHAITASYAGDGNFTASASTGQAPTQTVSQATPVTVVSSLEDPAASGQAATFVAVVSVLTPGSGTPTGTVTFLDGTTVLGSGKLAVVNGLDEAVFTTGTLTAGSHTITAVYNGDSNFAAGSASGPLAELIGTGNGPALHAAALALAQLGGQAGNVLSADALFRALGSVRGLAP